MKNLSLLFLALIMFAGLTNAQSKVPTFSGLFFGDYNYVLSHDNTNPVNGTSTFGTAAGHLQKGAGEFDYRRIYLTAAYDVAPDFLAQFRLESDPSASSLGAGNNSGKLSTMIKDAFIQWKNVTEGGNIIIGLQGTPQINMAEGVFGYRPIEKTIEDLHGISASRDLGVSYNQVFSSQFKAGLLVGNNSGNGVPANKYKAAYLYLQYNPVKEFTVLLNGQYNSGPGGAAGTTNNRIVDIILNYANSSFSLGGQYFANGLSSDVAPTLQRNGFSLNGWVALTSNLRIVARFDNYVPTTTGQNTAYATATQNLIMGALDWTVEKNVHIMPNIESVSYGNSNSTADLLARATFYVSF